VLFDSPAVEELIEALRQMPGIGKRTAERLALHLLSAPQDEAVRLSKAIQNARDKVTRCTNCGLLAERDPCRICSDANRDRAVICVVEQPAGAMAIEKGGTYRGLYHVLHGVINLLDGVGPGELNIERLVNRVEEGDVQEVIVATNATAEGESTAMYISRILGKHGVAVSRIAHGVPMGGGLEYADDVTLSHALQGRTRL